MFGIDNLWIEIPLTYWILFQVPACIVIVVQCISNLEHYEDKRVLLFWPLLIWSLREDLTKTGTALATVFISILFAPAILGYFVAGGSVGLIYLACMGFYKLFKRKD